MKKRFFFYILAALLSVCSCVRTEEDPVSDRRLPEGPAPKVPISFQIAVPNDGTDTKSMAEQPQLKNIVVAVFGDAGYFNEWVPAEATTEMATQNTTLYNLNVKLTMSASRLRLHIIANCPADLISNPPITGISTQDTEEIVMSKVRSHLGNQYQVGENTFNIEDGYWQKIYLPYGIEAEVEENGNGEIVYKTDANGIVATQLTKDQFTWLSPIPLVRNFARVQLKVAPSVINDWEISHVGLVNRPVDGVIAPILTSPYKVDIWGARLHVVETYTPDPSDPDNELLGTESVVAYPILSDNEITSGQGLHLQGHELLDGDGNERYKPIPTVGMIYDELFLTNYQNLPLYTDQPWRKVTDPPFNYGGSSPIPLEFAANPTSDSDLTVISDISNAPFLYVYERSKPRVLNGKAEQPTRMLIKARQRNVEGARWRYFPLDIVDDDGNYIALLRNNTYYVLLTGIDKDAGSENIVAAALSSGSNVSEDPATQDLNEVSDGLSSLAVEYVDKTLVTSGTYTLMYRYFPILTDNQQNNAAVTFEVGFNPGGTDGFQPGQVSGNGAVFAGTAASPQVKIEREDPDDPTSAPKLYVRSGNGWAEATTAEQRQTAWSMITYTTVNGNTGEGNKYFDYVTNQTIRVIGTNPGNNKKLHRYVQINLSMIRDLDVECAQKYVERGLSKNEDFIIRLPVGLTRSMFPLELKVEASEGSITPRDGDNLPAKAGSSIIDGQSSFYFIRTVTRQEYESLEAKGDWKSITCHFKTTKSESATAIYVANEYFNTAHDNFYNYDKRQFTNLAFSNLRQEGEAAYVSFSFNIDSAHSGTPVWDNNNGGMLPSTVKVLPRIISFEFTNLSPVSMSGDLIQTGFYKKGSSNNYYLYEVPDLTSGSQNPTFSFRVVDPSKDFSIKIHTKDLPYDNAQPEFVPNPILFDEASKSYTVKAVTGVSLSASSLSMSRGQQQTLTATCTPADATFKYVRWTSSDTSIATVDATGKVTAVSNGTAIITAEALPAGSGIKATCVVTVSDVPLTSVSIPATQTVNVGSSIVLTPTYNPSNASINTVTWTTSNGSVANVGQDGTVSGVASGTATITVTVTDYSGNTRSDTCEVTVKVIQSREVVINNPGTGDRTVTNNPVSVRFSNIRTSNASYIQLNRSSTITVSAGGRSLSRVVITYYSADYAVNLTANTGTYNQTTYTWTPGNDTTTQVVLTTPGSGTRAIITKVTVYYYD